MKRAVESDDAITFGMTFGGVMLARDLDRAFHRFRTGIGEENEISKAVLAESCRQLLAVRALEQVRHVPQLCRLLLQRGDKMRMRMAQRVHRDARGEIEIALAIGGDQPRALAACETEIGSCEYGKQMRRRAFGHGDH